MRYLEIPGIDRPVSVLGLGTSTRPFQTGDLDGATLALEAFLDAGGNCVDTAHIYGFGTSEKTLGRWIDESGLRDELMLITKGCHPDVDPDDVHGGPWIDRVKPEAIRTDLYESLERLRTDHVDLYLLHRDDPSVSVQPLVETLNAEIEAGRIGAFGASNWGVDRITEANRFAADQGLAGFCVSSPGLSLPHPDRLIYRGTMFADRSIRSWHEAEQFPMLAWTALASGFVSGRFRPDDRDVSAAVLIYFSDDNFERVRRAGELAAGRGVSSLQVGLAYVMAQPYPVSAVVGPSTVEHLDEALGALEVSLSPEDVAYLDLAV